MPTLAVNEVFRKSRKRRGNPAAALITFMAFPQYPAMQAEWHALTNHHDRQTMQRMQLGDTSENPGRTAGKTELSLYFVSLRTFPGTAGARICAG